jgi:hypothetical protein
MLLLLQLFCLSSTSRKKGVILTRATDSFIVCCGVERPPNFVFAVAFLVVIPEGDLLLARTFSFHLADGGIERDT